MNSQALSKLKAILIIDILIVASASGVYLYLQAEGLIVAPPQQATFTITNLTINPKQAEIFEPVLVTVNVTNIGGEQGEYIANLTVNNILEENQTIILPAGESTLAEFTVFKEVEGNYTIQVADLTSSLTLVLPPPSASKIVISKLSTQPREIWPNQTLTTTVTATNTGTETDVLPVMLMVDGSPVERKTVQLAAGESTIVEFNYTETTEGKHNVKVNALTGTFDVAPEGYHTVLIRYSGGGSDLVPITLNGKSLSMPYMDLLPVGEYTISAADPFTTDTAVFEFDHWSNGDTNPTTSFTLDGKLLFIATYNLISGWACCPSLFYWNGTDYVYVTEVSNAGWLGYIDYIDENGEMVFGGGNPWDTIKLDPDQLTQRSSEDGDYYDVKLYQRWDEIFYLDAAYMMVVDHPEDVDVYSTMVNYVNQAYPSEIYTVSKDNLKTPVSAINEHGENVLPLISQLDGVFTPGSNGLVSPAWNDMDFNQLTLDLGDLSDAEEVKLVIHGMIDWGPAEPYYTWIDGFQEAFAEGAVPAGTKVAPAPYMEVMDASGNWVRVPQDRQMPTPSDYVPRSFAVDLTGLFPSGVSDYKIRITNFYNVTFDYIAVDTTTQENINIQRINGDAVFEEIIFSPSSSSGDFTKHGDVTQIVSEGDDMFVIGRQGDQVSLRFFTAGLAPLEDGMERDYFMFVACWFKDPPGNWGYGFDFTVDPLPFRSMSGFPYPDTESYPSDDAHMEYLREYNTRTVTGSRPPLAVDSSLTTWIAVVAMLIVVVDVGVLVYFKKRKQ